MIFDISEITLFQFSFLQQDHLDFKQTRAFTIDLTYNNITVVDLSGEFETRFISEVRSKIDVLITNNPIQCDCFLYDFIRYLNNKMSPKVKEHLTIEAGTIECAGPEELKNTLLSSIKSEDYKCIPFENEEFEGICPNVCSKWKKPYSKSLIFNCSYKNLIEAPETLCNLKNNEYTNELNLVGNFLKNTPNLNRKGYDKVKTLLLSQNNIKTILKDTISPALRVSLVSNLNNQA